MKTCDLIAAQGGMPLSARPAQGVGAAPRAPLTGESGKTVFACPVCATTLQVARCQGEVAGMCPVCGAGVVAPQPDFGCRAMPYRDWLRLQEIDLGEPSTDGSASVLAAPGRDIPPPRRVAGRARPSMRWAAVGVAAAGMVMSGLAWRASTDSAKPRPPSLPAGDLPVAAARTQAAPQPALTSAVAPDVPLPAAALPAPPSPPTPTVPPLASALRSVAADGPSVVVKAMRTHDFTRSAPPDSAFACLKLTDATDATVTARAYVPLTDEVAAATQSLLPWGRDHRVAVRLRWQAADAASGVVAGYWRVLAIQDATPALTSAR